MRRGIAGVASCHRPICGTSAIASQFDGIAGFTSSWTLTLTGAGQPETVTAAYISDGLLDLFGIVPASGRGFSADEQKPGAGLVALVNESFWRRHFGSAGLDKQIVRLNGAPATIVGILPDAFKMPITTSIVVTDAVPAEIWLPLAANELAALRTVPVLNVVARLESGVTPDRAQAEIAAIAATLARDYPTTSTNTDLRVLPLSSLEAVS